MSESTITAKGQTTVPRQVREQLGAGPGTCLVWNLLDGARMLLLCLTRTRPALPGYSALEYRKCTCRP